MVNLMNKTPLLFTAMLLASATTLTGCNQYLSRHEGITSFAGEALAANEAISVVDTWPDGFDNTDIPTDGMRQAEAVKRLRIPKPTAPANPNGGLIQDITN